MSPVEVAEQQLQQCLQGQPQFPWYARRVNAPGDWENEKPDEEVAADVFSMQEGGRLSLFRIERISDLRRLVAGIMRNKLRLCATSSKVSAQRILPIRLEEVEELKLLGALQVEMTPGDLPCRHANSNHIDIVTDTEQAMTELVKLIRSSGRKVIQINPAKIKLVAQAAEEEKCEAAEQPSSTFQCCCGPAEANLSSAN